MPRRWMECNWVSDVLVTTSCCENSSCMQENKGVFWTFCGRVAALRVLTNYRDCDKFIREKLPKYTVFVTPFHTNKRILHS